MCCIDFKRYNKRHLPEQQFLKMLIGFNAVRLALGSFIKKALALFDILLIVFII